MKIPALGRLGDLITPRILRIILNVWPPFLGAGIRIAEVNDDLSYIRVELRRSWYNNNYVGVQFGGSIYAMVDPFYMLMLMHQLGDKYTVWDKAAQVAFLKPGRSVLTAEFRIGNEQITKIKNETEGGNKFLLDLPVQVVDKFGVVVARIIKTVYIRKK